MHKKPNATRPKAKTGAYSPMKLFMPAPVELPYTVTKKAAAISPAMSMPFQKALKLPATMPERIVSDVPPSREAVTISWTCLECELVKILVNSGISTAASVPQLIIEASSHHRFGSGLKTFGAVSTDRLLINNQLMRYEVLIHRIDAIQISRVNGASKLNSFSPRYFASEIAWLMKYDTPDMKSIRNRMAKIHTISLACKSR